MTQEQWERFGDKIKFLTKIMGMSRREANEIVSERLQDMPDNIRKYIEGFHIKDNQDIEPRNIVTLPRRNR